MPPQKRETTKIVELSGRRWQIGKFDALTGSYVAYQLMFRVLPSVFQFLPGTPEGMEALKSVQGSQLMSREEFGSLQRDCLSVCAEFKQVGATEAAIPVQIASGAWGVEGLEDDTVTVLALTAHALIFNVSSFFDGNVLTGLKAEAKQSAGSLFSAKQ
jgi:hypothetical protein